MKNIGEMMKNKSMKRVYSASEKATIALEALKGNKCVRYFVLAPFEILIWLHPKQGLPINHFNRS
jgi:hypothetical protein